MHSSYTSLESNNSEVLACCWTIRLHGADSLFFFGEYAQSCCLQGEQRALRYLIPTSGTFRRQQATVGKHCAPKHIRPHEEQDNCGGSWVTSCDLSAALANIPETVKLVWVNMGVQPWCQRCENADFRIWVPLASSGVRPVTNSLLGKSSPLTA